MELAIPRVQKVAPIPDRLVRFFERYPPQLYSAKYTGVTIPLSRRDAKLIRIAEAEQEKLDTAPKLERPRAAQIDIIQTSSEAETPTPTPATTNTSEAPTIKTPRHPFPPNPFLPFRNPTTGAWAGARIGLRQQADLTKMARRHDIEHLLPPSRKSSAFKEQRILEKGLRVKGTGEGQKVKGHKWERMLQMTLDKRREALEQMPALVREWEQRGHGRGWKKWPRARSK